MKNTLENEMLDAAVSWCDSNGSNVLEPEQLASLVNSLYITVCDAVLTAAKQAQPERAPLSDAGIEQEFCNIAGLETGINPAAADTKRALVWFKKGYAHGIKQGGQ